MHDLVTNKSTVDSLSDASKSILCVIDLQKRMTAAIPDRAMNRIVQNIKVLLESASILDIPVIVSEQSPHLLGSLSDEITEFLPEDTEYIEKTSFSLCGEEGFLEKLEKSGRTQIVLTGLEAHISVLQTAFELKEKGFDVFVIIDGSGSRYLENYKSGLRRMTHAEITMTSTDATIYEWLRNANHDQFEAVSSLLK